MECKFSVGQKVVCVDDHDWQHKIAKGEIYTVSAVGESFGYVFIGLEETPGNYDLNWRAYRFRPVIDRKTDISIFTDMLTTTKQEERA